MSVKRFTLDTNVLVYHFDHSDKHKQSLAEQIIVAATKRNCLLSLQAVGEFYAATTRNKILSAIDAAREAQNFLMLFPNFSTTLDAHRAAAREAGAGRLSYWDAILLASADEAGCTVCFSEDIKDGAQFGGITVRNPFGPKGLSAAAIGALTP